MNKVDPRGMFARLCPPDGSSCDPGFEGDPPCTPLTIDSFNPDDPLDPGAEPCTLQNVPSTTATAPPTCEQGETNFIYDYLKKYNSPLANIASWIVTQSDLYGIDDRFIVALAGRETSYGTNPKWDSADASIFNLFSNSQHCATVGVLSFCKKANPYANYGAAVSDVISTIASSPYYQGLNSADDIYNEYNSGALTNPKTGVPYGPDTLLDQIYGSKSLAGDLSDVRFARCP